MGGLHGHTGLGWLYIDVLWVAEEIRVKGFGTQLVEAAETEAVKRGCHSAYLYTYSFQQPKFYEGHASQHISYTQKPRVSRGERGFADDS
jgi:GNAT superfamily N-acetyltransferase